MKRQTNFKGILFFLVLLISATAFAQKDISGTVSDPSGAPLPGVAVVEKGTSNGVTTDFDGNYTISNVEENATLVFSYLGFKTNEVGINSQSTLNVTLEQDVTQLDDVVVIGYGTKKREQLTSSVAQIKGDIVKESPAANVATSLSGRLPGLIINQRTSDPGQENLDIFIRGRGTFGDNSVLIVVDGVVGRDGLARLDPQDIENISVIKDASASIYGARAANGVILVTTKRGGSGKPVITLNTNTSVSRPTTIVKGITPLNYARQVNAIRLRAEQDILYDDTELADFRSGAAGGIDFWNELLNQTAIEQRHNLSIRGGSDKVKYFSSLGYTDQNPILNGDNSTNFSQYNIRSNIDFSPTDDLTIGLELAGRLEEVESPPYLFQAVDRASKVIPLNESYVQDGRFLRLLNNQENPFSYLDSRSGLVDRANTLFNGTIKADYKLPFLKGLSVGAWFAVDYRQNYVNTFNNNPIQFILNDDGSFTESPLGLDILVQEEYFRQTSLTSNFKIAYENSFGDHNLETFLAFEQNTIDNNASTQSRRGGLISEDLPFLSQGDPETQLTSSTIGEMARQAYLGRLSYDYKRKYLASFGFRYDGSYIFPENKRFGFFPYASAGWVVTSDFFKESKALNFLKLRGTWGITGNDRVQPFQYLQRFQNPQQGGGIFFLNPNGENNSAIPLGNTNSIILSPIGVDPNANITWETATSIDVGFEARLFDNVFLQLTYYNEEREDILAPRDISIPDYTGLNPPFENIGKTKSQGFEGTLSYTPTIGAVKLTIGGNFTTINNELVFNDAVEPEEDYQLLEGRPIGSRLVYDAVGIYRTQGDLDNFPSRPGTEIGDLIYADTNDDGEITTADRIVLEESSIPTLQYGFNLGATYKNFSLNTFWQGQTGSILQIASFLDENTSSADYFGQNAYTPDNPNAILPAIGGTKTILNGYTNYENNFFTYDTSYLRLKNVQVSYQFPQELLDQLQISTFRIFMSGTNLLTSSKFNDLDFADVEQTNGLGYDRPLRKLYSLGLEVSF